MLLLLEVYEENLAPQRHIARKELGTLIALSVNPRYYSTEYHNSTSAGFLKATCSVKSEILSMNFLCSVTLKSVSLLYTFNETFIPVQ